VAGRTAVLIAGACALVLFAAFWLAPPRAAVGGNPAPGAV